MGSNELFEPWEEAAAFGLKGVEKPLKRSESPEDALALLGLSQTGIELARQYAEVGSFPIEEAVRELGLGSVDTAIRAAGLLHNMPVLTPAAIEDVDGSELRQYAKSNTSDEEAPFVPVGVSGGKVLYAIYEPDQEQAVRTFAFGLRTPDGGRIQPLVCLAPRTMVQDLYHREIIDTAARFHDRAQAHGEARFQNMLNGLLVHACYQGASDIHIEPQPHGGTIMLRVDGRRAPFATLNRSDAERLLGVIRHQGRAKDVQVHSDVALNQEDLPTALAGRFQFRVELSNRQGDVGAVIRVLDTAAEASDLDTLNFDDQTARVLRSYTQRGSGLVLVVGPTGSGKTTTINALMRSMDPISLSIQTIENPVEYQVALWGQHEIRRQDKDQSEAEEWLKWFRGLLRNDPDVMLFGEVRDADTAAVAVDAANTGHLVFSTMHTRSAASTVARLRSMRSPISGGGVDMDALASILLGILAQRLVRRLCPQCSEPDTRPETIEALDRVGLGSEGARRASANGCDHCHHSGYRGRRVIYELIHCNRRVREAIAQGRPTLEIEDHIHRDHTLYRTGLMRVARGETSMEEVRFASTGEEE